MKLKVVIMILSIVVCFFAAPTQAAQVSVEPAYQEVSMGDIITVDITVDPEELSVHSASYTLHFNNTLLNATSQVKGPFLTHDGATSNVWRDDIDNAAGRIEYAEARYDGTDEVSDLGVLATITFEVIGEEGISTLNISKYANALLYSYIHGDFILPDLNNGRVKVLMPSTPFLIRGYVSYEDGSPCNNSSVCIANLDTGKEWTAKTNETSNYYQLMLASGDDIVAGNTLRFNSTSPDGNQWSVTEHTVTQTEVDAGGFEYNITLEFLIGDVNGDGEITSADAVIALQMAVCGEYDSIADVNQDNSVTSLDALMIMQAAVGRITFNK
jgi:hypothetical protein